MKIAQLDTVLYTGKYLNILPHHPPKYGQRTGGVLSELQSENDSSVSHPIQRTSQELWAISHSYVLSILTYKLLGEKKSVFKKYIQFFPNNCTVLGYCTLTFLSF